MEKSSKGLGRKGFKRPHIDSLCREIGYSGAEDTSTPESLELQITDIADRLRRRHGMPAGNPEWLRRKVLDEIGAVLNPTVLGGLPGSPSKRLPEVRRLASKVLELIYVNLLPSLPFRVVRRGRPQKMMMRDLEIVALSQRTQRGRKPTLGQIARAMNQRHGSRLTPQAVQRVLVRARETSRRARRLPLEDVKRVEKELRELRDPRLVQFLAARIFSRFAAKEPCN